MEAYELVSGYRVIEGKIVSTFSGRLIEDVPVLLLQLCKEEKEILCEILSTNRGESLMLSEVLSLSLQELILLVDWRLSIVTQIRKAAKEYLLAEERRGECEESLLTKGISAVDIVPEPDTAVKDSAEADAAVAQQSGAMDAMTGEMGSAERFEKSTNEKTSENVSKKTCNADTSEEAFIAQEDCLSVGVQLESNQLQLIQEEETGNEGSAEKNHFELLEESSIPSEELLSIKPNIPVLAPDYFVYAGSIVHKATGKIIPDASIETLRLSVRAYKCLMREKLMTVASLVGMPVEKLLRIKNMGKLSQEEVCKKSKHILTARCGTTIL